MKLRKNIFLVNLISLVYLSFYFFSPFFHYHQENIREENNVDFHSHLFEKAEQKTNDTECHHTLTQDDEHDHTIVINIVISNTSSRFVFIPESELRFTILSNLKFRAEESITNYIEDSHYWKILKEKCVHSATNVSPPFILAT